MIPTNGPLIECSDLRLGYGRLVVLDEVHLRLGLGDYVGVVGPNGAGKTTLLKALTGILGPLSGTVKVPRHPSGRPLRFGYVAQSNTLDENYPVSALDVTLMGRIAFVGPFRPFRPDDHAAALNALERVGMDHRADWPFRELSRGQQQRVLLARALASDPDVLCLDEPTNFLDPGAQVAFMNTVEDMRQEEGMTIIIVTHLLQSVAGHADHIWMVQAGRIRVLSEPAAIKHELASILEGRNGLAEEAAHAC